MKICVISSTVFTCPPPGYSGLEQLAWQIAKGLASKGHKVSLVAPEGSSCPGVEIIPTGQPGSWDETSAFALYRERLPEFEVIIDHSWAKYSYLLKEDGTLKAPVLGVLHAPVDTMYSQPPNVTKPCFVCISDDQAEHLRNHLHRFHVDAQVAYNGIDLEFYKPLVGVKRTKRFLFLARFSTIKGADLAIEACREAGVGLDLVGDTKITGEPEFFERCRKMCDGTQIRMVGPATRGECVWWFSQAHYLLHPNARYREPFGLAPVEAQACGCPVIAWDYGAMRETVLGTGVLVGNMRELVEAVKVAASCDWERERCHCRNNVESFSESKMVDRYEHLCGLALETGGW